MWAEIVTGFALLTVLRQWRRSGLSLGDFVGLGLIRLYGRLWHGVQSDGLLPLPTKGGAIVFSNHTCSADPALLQCRSPRALSFVMAQEYYDELPFLQRFLDYTGCVTVRRECQDIGSVRACLRRLTHGRVLAIFPEGGLSGAGRMRIRRGKCGIALLALRSRVPVYPVLIAGGHQHHHVFVAWIRPSRARLYPGRSVDLSAYYDRPINRPLLEEVTEYLMQHVAALQPGPPGKRASACLAQGRKNP
jgi:1-acyl-sn-glycerol-3-phosphate acyltransferase